ncbi:alanine racemase [Rhodopseudomonas sp. RCAM05734]|uniref:alanine racemase n=1 Tax=Rhodopseudomonas sp. RCAM05734 TaxID=3457549 RepID=UPI004044A374
MADAAVREFGQHASATLTVDLVALGSNYRRLADTVGPDVVCAGVVKADAYGLGARRVAPALHRAGCRAFFVAHLDEGLDLRQYLPPRTAIYVLNGLPVGGEGDCAAVGLVPVLNSREQVDAWSACARKLGRALGSVVQVDSGMSRLGMSAGDVAQWTAAGGAAAAGIDVQLVMSHLACADTPAHPANAHRLAQFEAIVRHFPQAQRSLANSSGIFLGPAFRQHLVRPGAALYGINPLPMRSNPMAAVVGLTARVVQIRDVGIDAHVGYGWDFRAAQPTRLATLAIGYADGLHRALGRGGALYFRGRRLPVAGRVSMDSLTVDLGDLPPDALTRGSEIEVIGHHQSIDDLALAAGTIGYEILTGLGQRYQRIYIDDKDKRPAGPSGDVLQ